MTELLIAALEAIGEIIEYAKRRRGESPGIDAAADALTAIGAVVDAVRTGKLAPGDIDKAQADLAALRRSILASDAAADAAVKAKFGGQGDPPK